MDSLVLVRHVKVASGAPALVRQTIEQVVPQTGDTRKLATYRGGALRVRDLARWLFALNPRDVNGLGTASDVQLNQFVRRLTERDLLLQQVDSAGVQLTADDWREIATQHDSVVSILRNQLGLSARVLQDSAATEAARVELAMAHVDSYLDRVFKTQTAEFFPVPPFLAQALRSGQAWSVNASGVARAFERAQTIRAGVDSTARQGGPGIKPAPGPAPVPPDASRP
jgi:hypothetical protein